MKIAVASMDGVALSPHFGRSTHFIVFDVTEGKIVGRETRSNTHTAFAKGECSGADAHPHHAGGHSHADVVDALRDCSAVLCGGMGWRAAEELKAHGIQALVVDAQASPEEAVAAYLAGKIMQTGAYCRCNH